MSETTTEQRVDVIQAARCAAELAAWRKERQDATGGEETPFTSPTVTVNACSVDVTITASFAFTWEEIERLMNLAVAHGGTLTMIAAVTSSGNANPVAIIAFQP